MYFASGANAPPPDFLGADVCWGVARDEAAAAAPSLIFYYYLVVMMTTILFLLLLLDRKGRIPLVGADLYRVLFSCLGSVVVIGFVKN